MEDRSFTIYSSSRYHLSVSLSKGKFTLEGQEFGGPFGDEDEFFYSLNEEDTAKLVSRLMTEKDDEKAFSETVKNKFGKRDGVLRFLDFCEEIGVKPKFFSC